MHTMSQFSSGSTLEWRSSASCWHCRFSFVVHLFVKIPYGKLNDRDKESRCEIHLRIAFGISQILTGIVVFTVTFFLQANFTGAPNLVMYMLFTIHYINRGIVDTIVNRHGLRIIPVYIPLMAILVLTFYHFINGQFLGAAEYCRGYYYDPRFIIGMIMFIAGFIVNRVADAQLVCLREDYHDDKYYTPKGCSFVYIASPNYLGELIEWFGWAVMTWSLSGLVWFLFVGAIVIPRSKHYHNWYRDELADYPKKRKALIPFWY